MEMIVAALVILILMASYHTNAAHVRERRIWDKARHDAEVVKAATSRPPEARHADDG